MKEPRLEVERFQLPAYVKTALPNAAENKHCLIIVTDAVPPCLAWSDGTNWKATDDGANVA